MSSRTEWCQKGRAKSLCEPLAKISPESFLACKRRNFNKQRRLGRRVSSACRKPSPPPQPLSSGFPCIAIDVLLQ